MSWTEVYEVKDMVFRVLQVAARLSPEMTKFHEIKQRDGNIIIVMDNDQEFEVQVDAIFPGCLEDT